MHKKQNRHHGTTIALLLLMVLWLTACSGNSGAAAEAGGAPQSNNITSTTGQQNTSGGNANAQGGQFGGFAQYESAYLNADYESALPTTMQLMLGSLKLEEGDAAITSAQAAKLLPLWQGIQSGSITNATERNALYKAVEGSLDASQLEAIAGMQLSFADMTEWASANGIEIPQGGGQFGQRGAGGAGQAGGAGGNNPFAALTDEQRAELRQLSPEERTARLRELGIEIPEGGFGGGPRGGGQAGGGQAGGGQAAGSQPRGGRFNILMEPLIQLLTTRAAE